MDSFKVLGVVSTLLILGLTVLYGLNYKKNKRWVKLFFAYLLFLLIGDLISKWMWVQGQNNLLITQLFNMVELVVLTLFYLRFALGKRRKLILGLATTVAAINLFSGFYIYDIHEFNVIGFFAFKFFIILFSLRELFYHKMEGGNRCFWINVGLLLNSSVNVAILSFLNILSQYSSESQIGIWIFNAMVYSVALLLYGIEILNENKWKLTS